jgi:anti-sigma28 factor (negative regulator of flagellin synthesis)
MKINDPSALNIARPQPSQVYETPKSSGGSSPSAGPPAAASADHIDLGSHASLLSQVQTAGASESSATVQRLRALVQSGQYQVDSAALSHSIVSAALSGE